jgi:hypothetical protein
MACSPEIAKRNGKKGGRPRLEATKLREAIIREAEKRAGPLAKAIVDKAMEGDVPAFREVADRVLGKAAQSLDVTTNSEDMTPISQLDDDQLDKLIASLQRAGVPKSRLGSTQINATEIGCRHGTRSE